MVCSSSCRRKSCCFLTEMRCVSLNKRQWVSPERLKDREKVPKRTFLTWKRSKSPKRRLCRGSFTRKHSMKLHFSSFLSKKWKLKCPQYLCESQREADNLNSSEKHLNALKKHLCSCGAQTDLLWEEPLTAARSCVFLPLYFNKTTYF